MKTHSLSIILVVAIGCAFLSGCGSKQAKDQARSEDADQRAAQIANQALVDVDHKIAVGLYGPKPNPPPPPPPKPNDPSQPPPSPTPPPP